MGDEGTEVVGERRVMGCTTLQVVVVDAGAVQVRGVRVGLELLDNGSKETDALRKAVNRCQVARYVGRTVWSGGMLEWPPGAETSKRTSNLPFSATPGLTMMTSSDTPYPPEKRWCRSETSYEVGRGLLRRLTSFVY